MKKMYFLMALFIIANSVFAQNFTEGNLVLFRHNLEGTVSGGTSSGGKNTNGTKAVQIFLDEYKLATDGNSLELVQSVPLYDVANGANNPVTTFGADDLEGYMTRSYDGRYLIVPGYGVEKGTELSSTFAAGTAAGRIPRADVKKSIAVVDYQKNINSKTLLPESVFKERSFIGAASYDGTDLWLSGGWQNRSIDGPYYAVAGSTSAISLITATNHPTDLKQDYGLRGTRDIRIFNNQLFAIEGWDRVGNGANTYYFYKIGDGLPKTNNPVNNYSQQTSHLYNNGMAGLYIAKLPNNKVIAYVANGHSNSQTIRKYSQKADGSWVINFENLTPWGKAGIPAPKAIEGKVDPVTGKVTLYIVSCLRNASGGDSKVYVLEDEAGHNETAGQGLITGTPQLLLDITGQNKQFRSIAWAPVENSVLPIKLSSFEAKYQHNNVQLNWKTSSESNNSHFEILRSDGTEFKVIGTVQGAGNSNEERSYHFTDRNPLSGVSYYQLRQIDFDNKSELSKIIPVSVAPKETELKAYIGNSGELVVNIYAIREGKATVEVTDIIGRKILSQQVDLKSGYNTFASQLMLSSGIYVASLHFENGITSTKFIK